MLKAILTFYNFQLSSELTCLEINRIGMFQIRSFIILTRRKVFGSHSKYLFENTEVWGSI